ncbi:universal stress protein [Poritiphilus flavus]|uniref:Universal stress protein n=1 Tax=Poritiphilus flavus TaxID=2697053 RepID=A0A6L9EBG6_9FLAO|nr:universal stress protein [Poritiphilus flavus]NAS11911.1 universal stress protein [Poritiphilus flavus]
MKHVLVATDCNTYTTAVLQYAFSLSKALKSTLSVLHVFELPPIQHEVIKDRDQLLKSFRKEQLGVLKHYCEEHLGLPENREGVEMHLDAVDHYSVSEAILAKSEEVMADLIVVGMKEKHTLRGFFSGNIANQLLSKSMVPLLIVPPDHSFSSLQHIVYASDFEMEDIFVLKKLVGIAEVFEADITVVHVPVEDEYSGKDQMQWFEELLRQEVNYPKISFQLPVATSVPLGLKSFMESSNADILAMLERSEKGLFKKLFEGDTVKKMESKIRIPLLSFNCRKSS